MTDTWHLQSQLDRLYRRVMMTVAPTKISATDDTDAIHKVQVRVQNTPEILDHVGVMQYYGLASHAPVGTDATAMFVSGDRSNPVIIATGHQKSRLRNQKPGEISLYSDEGDTVSLQRNNQLVISSKDTVAVNGEKVVNVQTKQATIKGSDGLKLDSPNVSVTDKLTLAHDPGAALEAATKQYTDAGDGHLLERLDALEARLRALEAR